MCVCVHALSIFHILGLKDHHHTKISQKFPNTTISKDEKNLTTMDSVKHSKIDSRVFSCINTYNIFENMILFSWWEGLGNNNKTSL